MTRQIVLQSPPSSVDRRQPLLNSQNSSSRGRLAEVAGGTTAECAVVCCCCPCGLANLLFLVIYKLPAGLCHKALRRKRHRRTIKKGRLPPRRCGGDETELQIRPVSMPAGDKLVVNAAMESDKDVLELEKEMWDRFYGTGFWRSPSQRSDIINGK
ncbi:unnamed protein product [Ilex paraguariensis]|uniref:Pollen preferential protein n=1 Tax=Ilex paraguariensis TaxID=185542 RepID=A0ABC8SUH6_9AQUA